MTDLTRRYDAGRRPQDPPGSDIAGLLDDAHRTLSAPDLADLLLSVGRAAEPLSSGEPPHEPAASAPLPASPEVAGYLTRLTRVLAVWAAGSREGRSVPARVRLAAWLADQLDEVAARPRGAAVPAAG